MKVVDRLQINGVSGSVMIQDNEVTYPVFMTSLHNRTIFDSLIKSGYKFCGIPFDFRLDGVSIMSLPEKEYVPNYNEQQDMYDLDSMAKLTEDELRSSISVEDVTYVEEPPTNYIYTTREEFLEYLRSTQTTSSESVYLPINYFVHPNARFTVEEWRSGQYTDYFRIMEDRRNMSYVDYRKLRGWLKQFYPNADKSAGDFVEAYYAWGIDGINQRFVSKKRKTMLINLSAGIASASTDYQIYYEDVGLVDRYGAVFAPEDVKLDGDSWAVGYHGGKEDPTFRKITAGLKDNEYGLVKVRTQTQEDALELQTLKDTFTVTPYRVYSGKQEYPNFRITTFDSSPVSINSRWWSVNYDSRVYEMSQLRSIAYSIIQQRRRDADVSSFKALQYVGLDLRAALLYVVDRSDNTTEDDIMGATTVTVDPTIPTEDDVELYVTGNVDREALDADAQARLEYLDEVVAGKINVDKTAEGATADKAIDVKEIYRYLYALHFCRAKVPMDVLQELANYTESKVSTYRDNSGYESEVLAVSTSNNFVMNIPCPLLNAKIEGYNSDILRYKVIMANDCSCFCKVVNVAREYGTPEATRHVAFEAQYVKLVDGFRRTPANANLERMMTAFDNALQVLPDSQRRVYSTYRRSTCMREYFRVAESGYMLLGKELGNQRVDFPQEFVDSVRSTIVNEITSTAIYCRRLYLFGHFTHFCVNADITPYQVYPLNQTDLPELHIKALWDDLTRIGGAAIDQKLRQDGYLYPGFMAWTYRYTFAKHFTDITDMPIDVDLCRYMQKTAAFCAEVKTTEEFEHAPHIESYMYGYYDPEDTKVDMSYELRQGQPPAMVSSAKTINKSTYPEHKLVTETTAVVDKPLRRFLGFSAEDFMTMDNVLDVEMPSMDFSDKFIIVEGDNISTDLQDNLPYYAIQQLEGSGYPIVRLYGRKYIFRDMYGSLWEVTV